MTVWKSIIHNAEVKQCINFILQGDLQCGVYIIYIYNNMI